LDVPSRSGDTPAPYRSWAGRGRTSCHSRNGAPLARDVSRRCRAGLRAAGAGRARV